MEKRKSYFDSNNDVEKRNKSYFDSNNDVEKRNKSYLDSNDEDYSDYYTFRKNVNSSPGTRKVTLNDPLHQYSYTSPRVRKTFVPAARVESPILNSQQAAPVTKPFRVEEFALDDDEYFQDNGSSHKTQYSSSSYDRREKPRPPLQNRHNNNSPPSKKARYLHNSQCAQQ